MFRKLNICMVILLATLLSGCENDFSGIANNPDTNSVIYGSYKDLNVSYGPDGLFYSEGSLVKYYDIAAEHSYILCSKTNCRHNSSVCNAWFDTKDEMSFIDGVGEIGNMVYCVYFNTDTMAYELYCLSPNEDTRKRIGSIPVFYYQDGSDNSPIFFSNLNNTYYCNGKAWLDFSVSCEDSSYYIVAGIDLKTGNTCFVGENDGWQMDLSLITEKYLCFTKQRSVHPELTIDEYYKTYGEGDAVIGDNVFKNYDDYWTWYTTSNTDTEYAYWLYDIEKDEMYLIDSFVSSSLHLILGFYDDHILSYDSENDIDHVVNINLYDVKTGEKTMLMKIENGSTLAIAQGYASNCVLDEGFFFYSKYIDSERTQIHKYNIKTGEDIFLFEDSRNITFRIFDEYEDGFFGKMIDKQDTMTFYWISYMDFYDGKLDNAVKYQL